jgi:RNA polymerase sigma-70 factor (ECF subfamily)
MDEAMKVGGQRWEEGAGPGELYRDHAPVALRHARRVLRSDADAREVVHDVFVSLLQRPEQYAGTGDFPAFLRQAVNHAALNRLRARSTHARLVENGDSESWLPAAASAPPEDATALRFTLERLPSVLAEVAVYYHLQERTHDDIAQRLGCSRRHVGHLLRRLEDWARSQAEPARS